MDGVEHESAAAIKYPYSFADFIIDLIRRPEGKRPLGVHSSAPEGDPRAEIALEGLRLHPLGGALYRIEDVDSGLDDVLHEGTVPAAGMDHDLPVRVPVNPAAHSHEERLVEIAEHVRGEERAALGAVIGTAQVENLDVSPDRLADEFEITDGDVGLTVVYFVDIVAAGDMGNIPFLRVTDALRHRNPGRRYRGNVPESAPRHGEDDRAVGVAVKTFRRFPEVIELGIRNGAELRDVVCGIETLLDDGLLAHDGIEIQPVARHLRTPRK